MVIIWGCGWIGKDGIDKNLDEGVDMVVMKGFVLREEWMASGIIMSTMIDLMEWKEEEW